MEDIFSHFSKQQQAFWKTCVNCKPTSLAISFLRAYLIGTPYIYLINIYKYIWRQAHVVVSNATLWQTIIECILKTIRTDRVLCICYVFSKQHWLHCIKMQIYQLLWMLVNTCILIWHSIDVCNCTISWKRRRSQCLKLIQSTFI